MLQLARQDPKLMREHIRRSFLDLLAAELRHAPLLVVLDDLQWSDELSIGALDELLQTEASSPCCVLAFARPEVRDVFPRLWRQHKLQEIQLKGLSKRACERLIQQVLGRDVAPEQIARAIEQSAGNALFLEELIRSLSEGDSGRQSETVVAMLQARIGRLEPGARRAVRAAAILGQTFWRGAVEAIVGAGPGGSAESGGDVTAWFSTLVDAELIQRSPRSRLAGETEYLFRHALVRDAAYQLLTAADLQAGHRLAAEFLVRADESDAIVIAEHLERGDDRPAASLWLQRAAVQALDAGDFATALSRVGRAMSYAQDDEARQALKELELDAFRWQGSLHELARCATEAMQLFPVGSAAWCKAAAEVAVAIGAGTGLSILSGQLQTLEESLLGITVRPDNASAYMQCLARVLTQSSLFFGQSRVTRLFDRMQQAITEAGLANLGVPSDAELTTDYRQLRRTMTRTSSGRPADATALGSTVLGWAEQAYAFRASARFELDQALSHFENARRLFLRGGDLRNALAQATDRGFVLVEVGRYREAATWLTDLSAEIDAVGINRIASLARLNLGIAQARLGQHEAALETLHKAYEGFATGQSHRGLAAAYLALTHALAGRLDEGERLARRLAERIPEHAVWDCRSTLAQILLWQGRAEEALALVQRDVPARVVLTSSEGGISRQWLVRAEATWALGNREAAIAELERALRRLQAQADAIADPAIRHSYLHEVRDHARLLQLKTEWQISESPIER
jgi:tetratricopeptide (TPR) repeat protein